MTTLGEAIAAAGAKIADLFNTPVEKLIEPPAPVKLQTVYIAGPITGVADYKRAFNQAANDLQVAGYIPLNPAVLPEGMTKAQYMRIDMAMLDSADAVLFLPGWEDSIGANIEHAYALYIGKPVAHSIDKLEEVTEQ